MRQSWCKPRSASRREYEHFLSGSRELARAHQRVAETAPSSPVLLVRRSRRSKVLGLVVIVALY
jgi:ferric-dicitrate binding protein FerR (iron transport regulator)